MRIMVIYKVWGKLPIINNRAVKKNQACALLKAGRFGGGGML